MQLLLVYLGRLAVGTIGCRERSCRAGPAIGIFPVQTPDMWQRLRDDSSPSCHLTTATPETPSRSCSAEPRRPSEPWEKIIVNDVALLCQSVSDVCYAAIDNPDAKHRLVKHFEGPYWGLLCHCVFFIMSLHALCCSCTGLPSVLPIAKLFLSQGLLWRMLLSPSFLPHPPDRSLKTLLRSYSNVLGLL